VTAGTGAPLAANERLSPLGRVAAQLLALVEENGTLVVVICAAALAFLVLDDNEHARVHADAIRTRDDFPAEVGDALAFIAAHDVVGYALAVEGVLESFERRDEYLEDIPVADTVIVLQALAARRGISAELASPLLPS